MTYLETELATTIERQFGRALGSVTQQERDLLDQFHAGGTEAVDRMLAGLALTSDLTVLDVGCGLGGPARQVARRIGCTVVGVDITPAYLEAARALDVTSVGPGRVRYLCTDVAALKETEFDAAFTIHVQMNVADKTQFFSAIAAHLRRGARFAVFEVCRTGDAVPAPPLPWSLDGTDSFLSTAAELRATIEAAGFQVLEWTDDTEWVRGWFDQVAARTATDGTEGTLPAVLYDGVTRMLNFAGAIHDGALSVHRGLFTRDGDDDQGAVPARPGGQRALSPGVSVSNSPVW